MPALADLIRALKRQVYLLESATMLDDVTLCAVRPDRRTNWRRHWTRQDARRLECLSAVDMLQRPTQANVDAIWASRPPRTRVERYLAMRVNPDPAAARQEIMRAGALYVLPLIDVALKAHARLMESYADDPYLDAREADRQWEEAIEAIESYAVEPALTPIEARNKFCYESWQSGKTRGEINAVLRHHPDWEAFESASSVRSAVNSWANRFTPPLPIRSGQPGKKPAK